MTALILFQLVMICLMAIKKTVAPPLIVLPLVFISLAYMVVVHNTFNPPMQTLSLLAAADRDKEEEPEAEVYMKSEGAVDAYVSPSFTLE